MTRKPLLNGCTLHFLRDRVKTAVVQEGLRVEQLSPHIEKSQSTWFRRPTGWGALKMSYQEEARGRPGISCRDCISPLAWYFSSLNLPQLKIPPPLHLKCILLFCTLISFYTEFTFTVSGCFPTPDRAETHTHYIFCLFCISVLLASAQPALRGEKQRRKTYKTMNTKVVLIPWFREWPKEQFIWVESRVFPSSWCDMIFLFT